MNLPKYLAVALLAGVFAAPAVAGETPAQPRLSRLGLLSVGPVDEEAVARVHAFAERNLAVRIERLDAREPAGGDLEAEARAAAGALEPGLLCLVALVWPGEEHAEHSIALKEKNIAAINARALFAEDAEMYGRRLEKCLMKNYGLLMGLDVSPNPRSAMYVYKDLKDLDRMGRNFEPPFLYRFQQLARARNAEFITDSALLLIAHPDKKRPVRGVEP